MKLFAKKMYALIFIIQDKITADIEIYNKIFFKYFLIFIFKRN